MPSPSETHKNNNFAVAQNLRLSIEEISYPRQQDHHAAMEIELQNELGSPILTRTTIAAICFPLSNKPIGAPPEEWTHRQGQCLHSGGDEREGIGGVVYSDGINNGRQFENGVLEFSREMGSLIGAFIVVDGTAP
ncbi:unnamed protein product [Prunus armeniaca]